MAERLNLEGINFFSDEEKDQEKVPVGEPAIIKIPPKEKHPPTINPDDIDNVIIPPTSLKIPNKDLPLWKKEGNA